ADALADGTETVAVAAAGVLDRAQPALVSVHPARPRLSPAPRHPIGTPAGAGQPRARFMSRARRPPAQPTQPAMISSASNASHSSSISQTRLIASRNSGLSTSATG